MKSFLHEKTSKTVGIWIRVSTEDQAKGEGPEHHLERGRRYAELKGWQVKEVYHLEAVSGKSVIHHPETQRMIGDVRSGKISGLIFSKLARLARNTKELIEFAELFEAYKAHLISLHEEIDTSSAAGRLFYTLLAAMAQWEREEIVDRTKASISIRAKLGKPLGGPAPFGYQWKDKKLVINPEEAPVRKRMYELFLEHNRKKTVAKLLNKEGFRTRKGVKFTAQTVGRLIQDPSAKGIHRLNYTTRTAGTTTWALKPQSDWVYNQVEPIVGEDLWNQCNQILEQAEKGTKPRFKKRVQLFGGLTYCACGEKMYVPGNTPKYVCQKCRNKIPIVDLENIFYERLKAFYFSPEQVQNHLSEAGKMVGEKEALLQVQQGELQKTHKEMDRVYRLYVEQQISPEGFGKYYKPLEEKLKQLEADIPRLQGEIDYCKVSNVTIDQILADGQDLYSRWPKFEFGEKLKLVEMITDNIEIGKDEISINLRYIPNSEEMTKGWRKGWFLTPSCQLLIMVTRYDSPPLEIKGKSLCNSLLEHRMQRKVTQKALAKQLGVCVRTYKNWETGRRLPDKKFWPLIRTILSL